MAVGQSRRGIGRIAGDEGGNGAEDAPVGADDESRIFERVFPLDASGGLDLLSLAGARDDAEDRDSPLSGIRDRNAGECAGFDVHSPGSASFRTQFPGLDYNPVSA